jgi:hypothetical protein
MINRISRVMKIANTEFTLVLTSKFDVITESAFYPSGYLSLSFRLLGYSRLRSKSKQITYKGSLNVYWFTRQAYFIYLRSPSFAYISFTHGRPHSRIFYSCSVAFTLAYSYSYSICARSSSLVLLAFTFGRHR